MNKYKHEYSPEIQKEIDEYAKRQLKFKSAQHAFRQARIRTETIRTRNVNKNKTNIAERSL